MATRLNSIECVDSENMFRNEDPRKRNVDLVNVQTTRRSALSTLPANVKIQPSRGAKTKTGHPDNVQVNSLLSNTSSALTSRPFSALGPSKLETFTIFQDESDKENVPSESTSDVTESSLPENITRLYSFEGQPRAPLAALHIVAETLNDESHSESPMILDSSQDGTSKEICARQDYFYAPEYVSDIYSYLRELELKFRPKPLYIRKQPDITQGMRSILVDWLVEVAEEYKLQTETLYLAVSYIDRFLSCMSVLRSKLQLVGTASMFIAAKYEEIYPPEVREFVYITDDTYTKKQVLRMEHLILKVLAFDLAVPTAYYFLQRFCSVTQTSEIVVHLAQYLCELSLLEAEPFLRFLPSELAGSALCLANYTLGDEPWNEELQSATGYTLKNFHDCIQCFYKSFCNAANYPQQAVKEKYKSSRFHSVALISPPSEPPC